MNTLAGHVRAYVTEGTNLGRFTGEGITTQRQRLMRFSLWFGDRSLDRMTERAVIRWLGTLSKLSASSRRAYLGSLRQFTKWMVKRHHLTIDPCAEIPMPKTPRRVPRALSMDAVGACLSACETDRETAIILLGVGLGLRRAEIARAAWTDFDHRANTLRITGKGGHERVLPVPELVTDALRKLEGHGAGPIIRPETEPFMRHLTPRSISYIVERVLVRAGVKRAAYDGAACHSFRHTAASDVLDQCGDLRVVQQMLGHVNLSTTAVYLRVASLQDLREAMEGRSYAVAAEVVRFPERRSQRQRAA